MTENADLVTALEKQLFKEEYGSFELLYNENCKHGDSSLVSLVVMRNL